MQSKYLLGLLLGVILFSTILSQVSSLSCGQVFMGPYRGVTRDRQSSKVRLQANWQGFDNGGSGNSVSYAYAAISQQVATNVIRTTGPNSPINQRCRTDSGLVDPPDLVDFSFGNVGHNTSVQIKHQPLVRHHVYYVIIRATQNGKVLYSNTNGIQVVKHDDDDLQPYQQGLIAMGCAIFCLLCLALLLILLVVARFGRGEDKYTTTVHRNENVDKL